MSRSVDSGSSHVMTVTGTSYRRGSESTCFSVATFSGIGSARASNAAHRSSFMSTTDSSSNSSRGGSGTIP